MMSETHRPEAIYALGMDIVEAYATKLDVYSMIAELSPELKSLHSALHEYILGYDAANEGVPLKDGASEYTRIAYEDHHIHTEDSYQFGLDISDMIFEAYPNRTREFSEALGRMDGRDVVTGVLQGLLEYADGLVRGQRGEDYPSDQTKRVRTGYMEGGK